jgi:nitrate/nitrite transporter NarK
VRAAAGGIAFINSVGNLGGFIGPTLMGALKERFNGSYTPGLVAAFGLLLVGSALAYWLKPQPTMAMRDAASSAPIPVDDGGLAAPPAE